MILAIVVLLSAVVVNSQEVLPIRGYHHHHLPPHYHYDESPKPYSFSYNAPLEDGVGHSARSEVADGSGKVEGSYTVTNDEGHSRVVNYVADHTGFRANIQTNEPGTESKNPADVVIESTAPFSYSPYHYTPRHRRPIAAVVDPAAPVPPVDVVPENVVTPGQPPFYNIYNRNNLYRRRGRYPYIRY